MQTILTITDWVLFALLGFATAYLFIFALASMRRRRDRFPAARIEHRMAVLIPAYRRPRNRPVGGGDTRATIPARTV